MSLPLPGTCSNTMALLQNWPLLLRMGASTVVGNTFPSSLLRFPLFEIPQCARQGPYTRRSRWVSPTYSTIFCSLVGTGTEGGTDSRPGTCARLVPIPHPSLIGRPWTPGRTTRENLDTLNSASAAGPGRLPRVARPIYLHTIQYPLRAFPWPFLRVSTSLHCLGPPCPPDSLSIVNQIMIS